MPEPGTGHNAHGFGEQLEAIIVHIEQLEADKADVGDRIKTSYAAAGARGFDPKTIKKIIKDRKHSVAERAEEDRLHQLYRAALGMLDGTPLGDAARKRLADETPPPGEDDKRDDAPGSTPQPDTDAYIDEQEALNDARQAGSAAAMRKEAVTANPYPAGDACRAAWDEAWCRATGSDGMDIPDSWRRSKPKKEPGAGSQPDAATPSGADA
jgi:uncharacterized protein (UPF0335 family)